ncbi:DUF4150 domain-containing protein [Mesorhizobium sp. CGMCC 1.15528]|uniref:DUF4150 domain-containing protein n=1 Tax=Mesorhizobium zhangyense TaxID=1776730 RepID=A0A7C9RA28_9HYPH|nr:DUF4150 domain-containing protein [Mesorhizobium zhangyense]NGN43439.1 DUF4150 domain-containing protein [Mesorhizobium zhangyense]
MSNVFANSLEISGKAVSAKVIAAFPDVCFTPPENPATPPGVPVPYPSFGMAGDTEKGTGTVKIGGETVNIKNKSDLSKTTGTEAGAAAKKGIITSKNTGKEYDNSWSNNVKFDGEPVIRFTDLATNNHSSPAANTPPWPIQCKVQPGWNATCEKVLLKMTVYDPNKCDTPDYEAHHVIDNSSFTRVGARSATKESFKSAANMGARAWKALRNLFQKPSAHPGSNYHEGDAPAICLKDSQTQGEEHRIAHDVSRAEAKKVAVDGKWTYKQARAAGVESVKQAAKLTDEEAECVGLVLDAYYKDKMDCTDSTQMRAAGRRPPGGSQFATGSGSSVPSSPCPP